MGIRLVTITLGEQGSFFSHSAGSGIVPGFRAAVADTTGAGDAFFGSLVHQLLDSGKPLEALTAEELRGYLRFSNAVASLCIESLGESSCRTENGWRRGFRSSKEAVMYRVIIADDEPKVSKLIRSLIQWEALGLELVGVASDGLTALEMIGTLSPDIVITDIRMPGYDGIQLIEYAKGLKPETDFIIISGYRQFDYAQRAIRFGVEDYLVKPLKADEINGTLQKIIARYLERDQRQLAQVQEAVRRERDTRTLREQFWRRCCRRRRRRPETPLWQRPLGALNEAYRLQLKEGLFQAFFIKPDYPPEAVVGNGRRLLMEKTAAVTASALGVCCGEVFFTERHHGLLGLASYPENQSRAVRKAFQSVIDTLQGQQEVFPQLRVTVGLSPGFSTLPHGPRAFGAAVAAAEDRLLLGAGGIIDGEAPGDLSSPEALQIPQELRRSLINGLEVLNGTAVAEALGAMEARVSAAAGLRGWHLLLLSEELMETVRFGLGLHYEADPALRTAEAGCREALRLCWRQRDLFRLLRDYAARAVDLVAAQKQQEAKRPIREARQYIQTHYGSPLNLECVSQAVGFSPTYFSELFKKETGMNFLEYLTEVRVKEAKRFLADPVKTIAEVSEAVGYSDVKHFSKTFSRITGIQPSQYRKLYY